MLEYDPAMDKWTVHRPYARAARDGSCRVLERRLRDRQRRDPARRPLARSLDVDAMNSATRFVRRSPPVRALRKDGLTAATPIRRPAMSFQPLEVPLRREFQGLESCGRLAGGRPADAGGDAQLPRPADAGGDEVLDDGRHPDIAQQGELGLGAGRSSNGSTPC